MKTRLLTLFSAFIFGTTLSLVAADNAAPACSMDKSAASCPACACKKGEACVCEKGKCSCDKAAADKTGSCEKADAACGEKHDAACCDKSDKCDKDAAKAAVALPAGYPLKTCVVSGEELGSMGEPYVYTYKQAGKPDRTVVFCCKMCVKKFEKDPAKYLAALDAAAAK